MKPQVPFAEKLAADRRLSILLLLTESPAEALNEVLLQDALPGLGYYPSAALVLSDLAWLAEQELITTTDLHTLTVAKLLPRGRDVAHGRATVPGVARPMR